jgi:hypothetical protein
MYSGSNSGASVGEMICALATSTLKDEFKRLQVSCAISDEVIEDLVGAIQISEVTKMASVFLTRSNSRRILKELGKLPPEALSYSIEQHRRTFSNCGVERIVDLEVYTLGETSAKFAMNFPIETIDFPRTSIESKKMVPEKRVGSTDRWYIALTLAFIISRERVSSTEQFVCLSSRVESLRQGYSLIKISHQNYKRASKPRTNCQKNCFFEIKEVLGARSAEVFIRKLRGLAKSQNSTHQYDLLCELNIKEVRCGTTGFNEEFEIIFNDDGKTVKSPITLTKRYICDQFKKIGQNA